MQRALEIIITVLAAIGTAYVVLQAYRAVVGAIGVFFYKKFQPTDIKREYGICVAARNEEKVIKNLLDSIYNQDYPLDKLKIFICADNCTDHTADIVRAYITEHNTNNLFLYEHKNPDERTKGFALRYLFDRIKEDFGIESMDGYFVFDADNVLHRDYVTRMNEAFVAGEGTQERIFTSCRLSKNINQNWIAFSYAIHWMKTCLIENRGKYYFRLACRVQGTGFLFENSLVKNGWNYTTLTEDRSFCSDAVVQGYRITYCHDAVFYDEQPTDLKIACRQRLRWAKGHLQSSAENCPKLIKNMTKLNKNFFLSYDCYWLNFPRTIEGVVRKILSFICKLCIVFGCGVAFQEVFGSTIPGIFLGILLDFASSWVTSSATAILVLICFRKRLGKMPFWKTFLGVITYFNFSLIGKYATYFALFKKVEWKPIPHKSVMDMSDLSQEQDRKQS